MTPDELSLAIRAALQGAVDAGDLSLTVPDEVRVERPRSREHGDWATNVALQVAKGAGMPPREVATILAARLGAAPGVAAVDVAGPGFLNITLEAASAGELARAIVEAGPAYGRGSSEAGRVVNLEFISANPTGPMHIGHCRGAVVGDALAALLEFAGHKVIREYYVNDAGGQVDVLARSAHLRYREALGETIEIPEGLYPGDYLIEVGQHLARSEGPRLVRGLFERLFIDRHWLKNNTKRAACAPKCSSWGWIWGCRISMRNWPNWACWRKRQAMSPWRIWPANAARPMRGKRRRWAF